MKPQLDSELCRAEAGGYSSRMSVYRWRSQAPSHVKRQGGGTTVGQKQRKRSTQKASSRWRLSVMRRQVQGWRRGGGRTSTRPVSKESETTYRLPCFSSHRVTSAARCVCPVCTSIRPSSESDIDSDSYDSPRRMGQMVVFDFTSTPDGEFRRRNRDQRHPKPRGSTSSLAWCCMDAIVNSHVWVPKVARVG